MDVSVIPIGNSKSIRLTNTLIEKYHITNTVNLILKKGYIILKPIQEPRKDWEKAFEKMHKNGEDRLLIDEIFDDENFDEWI